MCWSFLIYFQIMDWQIRSKNFCLRWYLGKVFQGDFRPSVIIFVFSREKCKKRLMESGPFKEKWRIKIGYFFFQNKQVMNNASTGIIISNQTLVLQSVTRHSSGHYRCAALNSEGESVSKPFKLDVKCKWWIWTLRSIEYCWEELI